MYLCFQQHSQFLYCRLESSSGQLTVSPLNTVYCPEYDLVSFSATARGLTGAWISSDGDIVVRRAGHAGHVGWENVATCDNDMLLPEDLEAMNEEDPRQVYLAALFAPGAFLPSTLMKTRPEMTALIKSKVIRPLPCAPPRTGRAFPEDKVGDDRPQ